MRRNMTRRSLLSGFAAALGTAAVDTPLARAGLLRQSGRDPTPGMHEIIHFQVPFAPTGVMGDSKDGEAYLAQLIKAAVVPPLSYVGIYAHGWLTDAHNLMVIYDTMAQGYTVEGREIRRAVAAAGRATALPLALPSATMAIMTHWPSRQGDGLGLPIGLSDLLTFSVMEQRANLVGRTGMARLIALIGERLLAEPDLASTRLLLVGHSFGARVLAGALHALATQARGTFTALQTRNRIDLIMLQPAMPADALEPTTLTQAHPFGQLVNYQNLRILATMSQWDIPLRRFYPAQEAQQPSDVAYAVASFDARKSVPALGGAGPSDATWRAFNGGLPRTDVSVGPGFRYSDVLPYANQRLVVADLTPLHAAHRREDLERPAGQLPPFGRPDRRSMSYSGYHTDIYSKEIYQLNLGFTWSTGENDAARLS